MHTFLCCVKMFKAFELLHVASCLITLCSFLLQYFIVWSPSCECVQDHRWWQRPNVIWNFTGEMTSLKWSSYILRCCLGGLHLFEALLEPDNLQLHCFLCADVLFCCSFFCPLDQWYDTMQTVQATPYCLKFSLLSHREYQVVSNQNFLFSCLLCSTRRDWWWLSPFDVWMEL